MGDDYGHAGKRKSKNDKRKKRKQNVYKKGGKFRASSVKEASEPVKKAKKRK